MEDGHHIQLAVWGQLAGGLLLGELKVLTMNLDLGLVVTEAAGKAHHFL
jgi:hypothetical protein